VKEDLSWGEDKKRGGWSIHYDMLPDRDRSMDAYKIHEKTGFTSLLQDVASQ